MSLFIVFSFQVFLKSDLPLGFGDGGNISLLPDQCLTFQENLKSGPELKPVSEKSHHFSNKSAFSAVFFGEALEVPLVNNLTLKCRRMV